MPITRKRRRTTTGGIRRKKVFRQRRFRRHRMFPASLTSRRAELKSLDTLKTTYALNTTGAISTLNLIRVGSTFCNRIGRRVELTSLAVYGLIESIRTSTVNDWVRIIILYDRQTNGAAPAQADIIQSTDQATTNQSDVFSGINLNNRDRFIIIRDMRIYLPTVTNTAGVLTNVNATDPISKTFRIVDYMKLGGMLTQFKADSAPAVVGDISTGGLFLLTIGRQASGSEGYQASLEFRLRYRDHS